MKADKTMPLDLVPPETLPVAALEPVGLVAMFERLARDPSVDVDKLERLIAMQERVMRHNAKAAYEATFARMQPAIPEIDERGQITVKGTVRSTYAKLEDINAVLKPILADHGFALRHRTEWPADKPGIIRIVGILSHEQGHSEESSFEAPMDRSDYRTDIQSMGSTVSYGRRYTTLDLLNITTRGLDNDGKATGAALPPPPPDYLDWLTDMTSKADEGIEALRVAWKASKPELRDYATKHAADTWARIKVRAEQAGKL